jgi:hypothetical protein
MKKALFFAFLTILVFSSFAQDFDFPSRDLYIEGTAAVGAHRTYFLDNFKMEATSLGFNVVNNKEDAGFTFRFDSQRYDNDFIVLITLTLNEGDVEIVNFGWPYSTLDEMYEYNQFVFFKAVVLIPGIDEGELRVLMEKANEERVDRRWQDQRIYFRVSFDYPVSFYQLLPDELYGDPAIGVYKGDFEAPDYVIPLNHYTIALPALTAGLELQPIKFLGIEANIQAKLGQPESLWILKLIAGGQVKIPIRFKNVMVEPYGAFMYPLTFSKDLRPDEDKPALEFISYPDYFVGGGVQICIKGGKKNAFFLDLNYVFAPGQKTILENMYPDFEPSGIHYKHYVIGIGIGYKMGFWSR